MRGLFYVESEYYYDPETFTVAANVTGLYGADLQKLLAEVGEEFLWVDAEFRTVAEGNDVSQWMMLNQATRLPV